MKNLFLILIMLSSLVIISCNNHNEKLILSNPDDYLESFLKTRADLTGQEVVYWWKGYIYSFVPNQKDKAIMQFEGFNISRLEQTENGYLLLTKEAAFYEDLQTGKILNTWDNPFTEKTVEVVHIWNNPVNQAFEFPEEYKPYINKIFPSTDLGDNMSFNLNIFLDYPSPLTIQEFPLNSQNDTYEAAEMFQFFVNKDELLNKENKSVNANLNWTRISPWMPFMEMGNTPGNLVFSCVGKKLNNGYQDLPVHIKQYVEKNKPEFSSAPDEYSEPNETSWTFFKKLHNNKQN